MGSREADRERKGADRKRVIKPFNIPVGALEPASNTCLRDTPEKRGSGHTPNALALPSTSVLPLGGRSRAEWSWRLEKTFKQKSARAGSQGSGKCH